MKTMTAEEVERDVDAVKVSMYEWGVTTATARSHDALSRLAAQAARVPGLEEECERRTQLAEDAAKKWNAELQWALSERDAARKDLEGAEISLKNFRTMKDMDEETIRALRERVATLETRMANLAAQNKRCGEELDVRTGRAVTAEARVRELADELTAERAIHSNAQALIKALRKRASQPPPAPAQGDDVATVRSALDVLFQRAETDSDEQYAKDKGRWVEAVGALDRIASRLSPTPPPGLREAVGVLLDGASTPDSQSRYVMVPTQDWNALLAAYDATGGEHGPDATCPNCKADHEDAAKYRAAVARLDDRAGQVKAAHEAWGSDPEGAVARWVLYGDGVPPAPRETLDKARVVEVIRDLAQQRMDRPSLFQTGWVDALSEVATGLGLTLSTPPSGPGGGVPVSCTCAGEGTCAWCDYKVAESRPLPPLTRARIAPTPTPEAPPLKPKEYVVRDEQVGEDAPPDGWCEEHDWDTSDGDVADGAKCRACTAVAHEAGRTTLVDGRVEPQPTTPAVVWEEEGLTVFDDGSCKGFGLLDPVGVCKALARALAEAKREVAITKRERDTWTSRAAEAAAESMRERAAQAAKTARHRVLVTDESFGVYAMACEDIEIRIRRLPLE